MSRWGVLVGSSCEVLRFLLWRLLGLLALIAGFAALGWLLDGGPGKALRGESTRGVQAVFGRLPGIVLAAAQAVWRWSPAGHVRPLEVALVASLALLAGLAMARFHARRQRRYIRFRIEPHRTDQASAESVVRMFDVVQFLDSPGARSEEPEDGEGSDGGEGHELVGVGAGELDVGF